MTCYKATRPDGTDFRTGTVDYASAMLAVTAVKHPYSAEMVRNSPSTYLSVSVEPAETLIGGWWPCRLFEVEPIGDVLDKLSASRHKRACLALIVIRELPAHLALGPNGQEVAALAERAGRLTRSEVMRFAGQFEAWGPARDAARRTTRDAARRTARGAAWDAAWRMAWGAAASALVVRDLITPEQFDILTRPWVTVMGAL